MVARGVAEDELAGPYSVGELSRRYYAVLLRYYARRGVGAQDAQDLTQEVFVRLSKAGALESIANVESYLFTAASNALVDMVRRRKIRGDGQAERLQASLEQGEDLFTPDRLLEGRQELGRIVAALNEMPERMRNIFILARLENLPRAEIAARLGISKSLVEQQITQATACLLERRRRIT